ncbi:hypothetical protein F4780DRAFT_225204 [Xylariomycetidae sp. FL0641]|nr:hypothetical protein F4780DRAFT_225204 [Xylariomycetidae sp. FL0641]
MDDNDDATAAMAAAMGFSSFGAQNPNKRRKFNPSVDAVVASSSNPKPAVGPTTSGSNATPLGVRVQNRDEIDLDDDDDDDNNGNSVAMRPTARDAATSADDNDPGPQYLDTSRPSAPLVADVPDDVQSRIDSIVGESTVQPVVASSSTTGSANTTATTAGHERQRPHQSRRRDSGRIWWEDYHDPSSNVNPWERLEQSLGLKPQSRWMSWDEAKAS